MAENDKLSRRHFIVSAVAAVSGLVVSDPVKAGTGWSTNQDSGPGVLTVNLDEYAELHEDGGFKVIKNVTIGDTTDSLIIVRKSEKEFLVFSSVCRHRKCNVKYKKDKNVFVCPCHESTYDINGKVIKGPSKGDIPAYKVQLSGNQLEISTF